MTNTWEGRSLCTEYGQSQALQGQTSVMLCTFQVPSPASLSYLHHYHSTGCPVLGTWPSMEEGYKGWSKDNLVASNTLLEQTEELVSNVKTQPRFNESESTL